MEAAKAAVHRVSRTKGELDDVLEVAGPAASFLDSQLRSENIFARIARDGPGRSLSRAAGELGLD